MNTDLLAFISSTFTDMQEERRALMEAAMPELVLRCRQFGVSLREIDLRWGVTADQVRAGQLVPACLEAIERSDIFIGILGDRYGQVVDQLPQEAIERWPGLEECLDRSLTEIEVRRALQRRSETVFRIYCKPTAEGTDPRVVALKDYLRHSGVALRQYEGAAHLTDLVHADVWRGLRSRVGRHEPELIGDASGPLELAPIHRSLLARWRKPLIDEPGFQSRLRELLGPAGARIAVFGDDRTERAAVIVQFLHTYRAEDGCPPVVAHVCSASRISSNVNVACNVLAAELFDQTGRGFLRDDGKIQQFMFDGLGGLRHKLDCVFAAAAGAQVTVVIDGVDDLQGLGHGVFPLENIAMPADVRLVVGVGSRAARVAAERAGYRIIDVDLLREEDVIPFATAHLASFGKRMDWTLIVALQAWPCAKHKYALRTLLDELRHIDGHEGLNATARMLLESTDAVTLTKKVFKRVDRALAPIALEHVRWIWTSLLLSRRGVSERVLDAPVRADGKERSVWALFRSLLAEHLDEAFSDSFRLSSGFKFDFVFRLPGDAERAALEAILDLSTEQMVALHLRLVSTLIGTPDPEEKAELVWHLWRAEQWDRLERLLSSVGFLGDAYSVDPELCLSCWRELEDRRGREVGDRLVNKLLARPIGRLSEYVLDFIAQIAPSDATRLRARFEPETPYRPFAWGPISIANKFASDPKMINARRADLNDRLELAKAAHNERAVLALNAELASEAFRMGDIEEAKRDYVALRDRLARARGLDPQEPFLVELDSRCARAIRDCEALLDSGSVDATEPQLHPD